MTALLALAVLTLSPQVEPPKLDPSALRLIYSDLLTPDADHPLGDERFWYSQRAEWDFVESVKDDGIGSPAADSGPCLTFKSTQGYKPRVRSPHSVAILRGHEFEGPYAFEVEAMQTGVQTAHRDLVLFFGFQSPEQYFYAHLGMVPDATSSNVFEVNEAPRRRVGEIGTKQIQWGRGVWHQLRVECDGLGHVRVFMDDMETPHFERDLGRPAGGQIGFGSFDDAGAFRNLKVWGSPSPRAWRSNPFGDVVIHAAAAYPKVSKSFEFDKASWAARGDSGPESLHLLAQVGRGGQWAVLVDADEDGELGSPGDRWMPTSGELSRWVEPENMLALTDAAVTVDRIALQPLLESDGTWASPFRFQTRIPKRSRSEYLKEQYIRHCEGHAPQGPWVWGSDHLHATADPRPVLWALTPSHEPESWRWDEELFSSETVQARMAEDFVLIRREMGPRSLDSGLIPFAFALAGVKPGGGPMLVMQRHDRTTTLATTELSDPEALLRWLDESIEAVNAEREPTWKAVPKRRDF
ncbi:MAG: hypothetical protein ACJA2W_001925 [Planctomycetota bacterium]|jgi:hypothetical protein